MGLESIRQIVERRQRGPELPPQIETGNWKRRGINNAGEQWLCARRELMVLRSATERDGNSWLHVSLSRFNGTLPAWDEIKFVKDSFLASYEAYIVMPPPEHYIDAPPKEFIPAGMRTKEVLHLWARMDGKAALPDFRIELPNGGWSI